MAPLAPVAAPVKADGTKPSSASHTRAVGTTGAPPPATPPTPAPLVIAAPNVVAMKADAFPDPNMNGKAEPGDTVTYTVTISNTGTMDAAGVTFADSVDPNTTLVSGSVNTQPVTDPDTYPASGNIPISLAAPGVLTNDRDPDTGDSTGLTVTKVQGSSANVGAAADTTAAGRGGVKGTVTLNSDGSFTYEPPPGFEGADTFTYETSDGSHTDSNTVTINISGMAWFVRNDDAGSANRGTFSHPFTSLAAFNAANNVSGAAAAPNPKDGDFISLRTGTGSYGEADGVNLRAQQKLVGQGVAFDTSFMAAADSSPAYQSFATSAGTAPTITTSAGNGIDLAADNTVRGLNVGSVGGSFFKLSGGAVGSPTINAVSLTGAGGALSITASGSFGPNVAFGTLESTSSGGANLNLVGVTGTLSVTAGGAGLSGSGASSPAVNVTGGSVSFTYPGSVSKAGGTGALVSVSGGHSGTITFTGALLATAGTGLQFSDADGTYNFSGATALNGGDAGVDITNGSGGTFNFSAQTSITSPSGTAFNVASSPGAPLVTYSGAITQNTPGQRVVNVDGTSGGSVGLNSVTAGSTAGGAGNTGVRINNAAGGVSFTTLSLGTAASRMTQQAVTIAGGAGTYSLGTVSIFTNNASGVVATDAGGTLNITSGAVSTTNTGAVANLAAVRIDGPAGLTTLGMNLTSVSANGTAFGIQLQETNGSFTVTGNTAGLCGGSVTVNLVGTPAGVTAPNTADCSGGTLENISTSGIQATNATNVSLTRMYLLNANTVDGGSGAGGGTCTLDNLSTCNGAIDLSGVSGVSLSRIFINGTEEQGIVGLNVTNFNISNSTVQNAGDEAAENGVYFLGLFGTVSVTGSTFTGSAFDNFGVLNDEVHPGTLSMTFTGNRVTSNSSIGGDGLLIDTRTGSNSTVNVANNTFTANKDDHFNMTAASNGVANLTVANNTMTGGHASAVGQGIAVRVGNFFSGSFTFDINGNSINGAIPTAINTGFGSTSPTGIMRGTIRNNLIGTAGVNLSGSMQGSCILVEQNGTGPGGHATAAGTYNALVTGNTLRQCFDKGIDILASRDGNHTMNVTVNGNNVSELTNASSRWAVRLETGSSLADETGTVCADIANNTLSAQTQGDEMSIRQRSNVAIRLPGILASAGGSAPFSDSQVATYLQNRNPAGGTATSTHTLVTNFQDTSPAGTPCIQPTLPVLPSLPLFSDEATSAGGISDQTSRDVPALTSGVAARSFAALPRAAGASKPVKTEPKRTAGTTFRHTATASSAPLNLAPLPAPEPVAQRRRKVTAPVLSDTPGGPKGAGGTVTVNVGTLRPGDSVTITFQVTVDDPYTGPANVSNQGTVSGANFSNVSTNDPDTPAAGDATLTPINSIDIRINDAKVAEPPTPNTADMIFTVSLSGPAPGAITVDFATGSGGANPAAAGACGDPGADYAPTSGTVTFAAGEQVKFVNVPVCPDVFADDNETFLVNLIGATGGTIVDNQAVGTITANMPGVFLISELRTSGPAGAGDDFVELYNNSDSPLTVAASDASAGYGLFKMGADCDDTPVLIAAIPNGTVIPARSHYLLAGSSYSLANYGGVGAGAGDQTLTAELGSDANVGLFTTADVNLISSATKVDGVGFGTNTGGACDLLREGSNLPAVSGSTTEHSFFRKLCDFVGGVGCSTAGNPKDTGNNSVDFTFADTQATVISGVQQRLGAPGPENASSPLRRDTKGLKVELLDRSVASAAVPNRLRTLAMGDPLTSMFGSMLIRRRVVNNTGGDITRLRFRIIEMTTKETTPGIADLRALTGSDETGVGPVNDSVTCFDSTGSASTPCSVDIKRTSLEEPPAQAIGGGLNSTLSVTLGTPLQNGKSINVSFRLGVQQTGTFRFLVIVEALP